MTTLVQAASKKNADTRQSLLLMALQLYAREGLHAVSLRRISIEGGSKNSGAMHYHFHNKLGVIQALIDMIAEELAHIATAIRPQHQPKRSLRNACRGTLRPLVELPKRQDWGADGLKFLSRLASESDVEIATMVNTICAPFSKRLDHALAEQLPTLSAPVRRLRLMFMSTNVFHGVAEVFWLTNTPLGDLSYFDEDILLDHLVDYLIGGLQAPSLTAYNPAKTERTQ